MKELVMQIDFVSICLRCMRGRDWGTWLRASARRSSGEDGGRWLREGTESVTATLFQPPNQSQHINEEAVTDGYNMNSERCTPIC
jgi:hypothetical protein